MNAVSLPGFQGILIGMSVAWVPLVAILKAVGISLIPYEGPGWFPEKELREHYGLDEGADRKNTTLEKNLLGFRYSELPHWRNPQ